MPNELPQKDVLMDDGKFNAHEKYSRVWFFSRHNTHTLKRVVSDA